MLDGAATAVHRGPRLQALAAIALSLAAAIPVLSLGIGAPFEKDQETQSAQWIEAVVERGEWLLPRDDYGGIDRKPPLYYWVSAGVARLRGARAGAAGARVDEADARIVPCVAGAILAVVAMRWCAAFAGEGAGWLALAFLLGTYGFASRATVALTDMLLALLLFGAWWCVYGLLEGVGGRARAIGAGILLGLAILTKGPVAVALLGLAGVSYLLLTKR
jgi:4-amino-4-deoxy-L-arabinose transferase-like glycosyltransferase